LGKSFALAVQKAGNFWLFYGGGNPKYPPPNMKFGTAKRTVPSFTLIKFHAYPTIVSPVHGDKPQNRLLSIILIPAVARPVKTMHEISSDSPEFYRRYYRKHFGLFFRTV